VDYALGEGEGKADGGVDPLQFTPEKPSKRRRRVVADSDADFKESENESDLDSANEPATSMKLVDPRMSPNGVVVASDPRDVKSAKAKPQGTHQQVQK
jgi:hypothetical protein